MLPSIPQTNRSVSLSWLTFLEFTSPDCFVCKEGIPEAPYTCALKDNIESGGVAMIDVCGMKLIGTIENAQIICKVIENVREVLLQSLDLIGIGFENVTLYFDEHLPQIVLLSDLWTVFVAPPKELHVQCGNATK